MSKYFSDCQLWVVLSHGLRPDQYRIALRPQLLNLRPRRLSRHPPPAWHHQIPIQRHRQLKNHPRLLSCRPVLVILIQLLTLLPQDPFHDPDLFPDKNSPSNSLIPPIHISRTVNHLPDPGRHDPIGAWRRPSMGRTRLQRHIEIRSFGLHSSFPQCLHLGMGFAGLTMESLPHDPPSFHHDSPHPRIRPC